MIAFLVGLALGAVIVFLLSLAAHYTLLDENRQLKREVVEFRDQELERLLTDVAIRCIERPKNVKCN